jgi:U2-associated protein SR140
MLLDSRYRPPPPPPPPFQDEVNQPDVLPLLITTLTSGSIPQGNQDILSSDDSEVESQMKQNKRGVLGRLPRAKLEAMLRTLTNTREKIARVMAFALDRPDAAEEVSDVLIQSLLIGSTPVPRKIARLSVISDILHNCAGTPTNAWKYRSLFETKLPLVFTHFGEIYKSFPGRMKAEVFRKQITTITQVWEQWLVFNPSVLADLDKRLTTGEEAATDLPPDQVTATIDEHKQEPSRPSGPAAGFLVVKSGRAENTSQQSNQNQDDDIDGEALEPAIGAMQDDDVDVDGDPIDGDDIDGAPL